MSGSKDDHLSLLLGVSVAFILLAWLFFEKSDLRLEATGWLRIVTRHNGVR